MKITLMQTIKFSDTKSHWANAQKEYQSCVIPHVGDKIEDGLWKDAKEVIEVLLSYDSDSCTVVLEEDISEYPFSKESELKKMVECHSWKIIIA